MMEDVRIFKSFEQGFRYLCYDRNGGTMMLGPMPKEVAEHIAACLDACRWRKIETAPKDGTRVILANNNGEYDVAGYVEWTTSEQQFVRKAKDGEVYKTVHKDSGYFDTDIFPTHWRPIGPLPGGDE